MTDVPTPHPGGRPTKYTDETVTKICTALELGATRKDACAVALITFTTFAEWMKQFPEFSEAVTRAEATIANEMAARITEEARKSLGDWRAALEFLKRRRKDDWSDVGETQEPPEVKKPLKYVRMRVLNRKEARPDAG